MDLKTANKERLYRSIAGVLFVISGIFECFERREISVFLVSAIIEVLIGITLFVDKKKLFATCLIAQFTTIVVAQVIDIISEGFSELFILANLFLVVIAVMILNFDKKHFSKGTCFIPSIFFVVGHLLYRVILGISNPPIYMWFELSEIIYIAIHALPTLFTCLWLTTFVKPKPISDDYSQTNYAERLTAYKKLLDEGAITQEEYDEIKRRLI